GSYLCRFLRWHVLVRQVAPRLRLATSLRIYMAGFAMGLTPGRVGELCKFTLLRDATGVSEARSAVIFPIERVTEAASFAARAVDMLLFWTAGAAVGLAVSLPGAALAWGLAGMTGGLLLLPGGVGAVEGSLVATVAALGGDPSTALLAALLARCMTLWLW